MGGAGYEEFLWRYNQGKERLEKIFGLEVVEMEHTLSGTDYIYNHPEKRAGDLMNAFTDSSIKGIIACIGGIESIRMLPYTIEDIQKTLLLNKPIGQILAASEWTSEYLPWIEENKNLQRKYNQSGGYELLQGSGIVNGRLLGGYIEVFDMLRGTEIFPEIEDFNDSILFFETSEEKPPV